MVYFPAIHVWLPQRVYKIVYVWSRSIEFLNRTLSFQHGRNPLEMRYTMVYPKWWFDREKDDKPVDLWGLYFQTDPSYEWHIQIVRKRSPREIGHFASVFRQKTSLLFLGCWEQPWRSRVNGIWSIKLKKYCYFQSQYEHTHSIVFYGRRSV